MKITFFLLLAAAMFSCKEQKYVDSYELTYFDGTKDTVIKAYSDYEHRTPQLLNGRFFINRNIDGEEVANYVRSYKSLKP